jgi:hypothetical protein
LIRRNRLKQLPFSVTLFGSWWGNDSKSREQSDIDIIAADRRSKKIILAECKWKNQYNDVADIQNLMGKIHLFQEFEDRTYYFFSKVPFKRSEITWNENTFIAFDITGYAVWRITRYLANHWCSRRHVLFVMEGELVTELSAGRKFVLPSGTSYQVADEVNQHRSERGQDVW